SPASNTSIYSTGWLPTTSVCTRTPGCTPKYRSQNSIARRSFWRATWPAKARPDARSASVFRGRAALGAAWWMGVVERCRGSRFRQRRFERGQSCSEHLGRGRILSFTERGAIAAQYGGDGLAQRAFCGLPVGHPLFGARHGAEAALALRTLQPPPHRRVFGQRRVGPRGNRLGAAPARHAELHAF